MLPRKTIEIIDSDGYTEKEEEGFAEELSKKGYPDHLDALDGSEHLFPRHLFNGVHFYSEYDQQNDQDFLTMAFDCASFPAMQKRTELECEAIKAASETGDSMEDFVRQLKADCHRLGNLYRTIGYAHGARIFMELANSLTHSDQDGMLALSGYFKDEAIRKFFCATLLEGDEVSKQLVSLVLKDKTVTEAGWLSDKDRVWLFDGVDDERKDALRKEAQNEIDELIKKGAGK